MCSFLFTSLAIANLTRINFFQQKRGPDLTTHETFDGFHFVHNLLWMTGKFTPQPFSEGGVVAMMNGEVYNYLDLPLPRSPEFLEKFGSPESDGEVLLPMYAAYGSDFVKQLDGEFSLLLADFNKRRILVASDVFGTKPLFIAHSEESGVHVATYESALQELGLHSDMTVQFPPNAVHIFQMDPPYALLQASTVFEFDTRQFKTSTKDWVAAFDLAIKKRIQYSVHPVFLGLSSGYDSGAVQVGLLRQNFSHFAYSIFSRENEENLIKRAKHAESFAHTEVIMLSSSDFSEEMDRVQSVVEPYYYSQVGSRGWLQDDAASVGLSYICRVAREKKTLVYLSGTGSDEILSDYGYLGTPLYPHATFAGWFPSELLSIFPWKSFFLGTQRDYLMKEEMVAGSWGVEGRYPFLDKRVVQEFLWLSPETKNSAYKRPVLDLLEAELYPFVEGKQGFDANDNLREEKESGVWTNPRRRSGQSEETRMASLENEIAIVTRESRERLKRIHLLEVSQIDSHLSFVHLNVFRHVRLQKTIFEVDQPRRIERKRGSVIVLTCVHQPDMAGADMPAFKILRRMVEGQLKFENVCVHLAESPSAQWTGMHIRVTHLLNFIRGFQGRQDVLFLVVDGLDIIFNDILSVLPPDENIEEYIWGLFLEFNKLIVLSSEALCGWGGANECAEAEFSRYPDNGEGGRYVNAGSYAGLPDALIYMLESVQGFAQENPNFTSDQRLVKEFYWQNLPLVALDTHQRIFGNLIEVAEERCRDGWVPPCKPQPCCPTSDKVDKFYDIVSQYKVVNCAVAKFPRNENLTRIDNYRKKENEASGGEHSSTPPSESKKFFFRGDVREIFPLTWHGNGVGKWIFILLLDELSRTCPVAAEEILSSVPAQQITDVLGYTERFAERSPQYLKEKSKHRQELDTLRTEIMGRPPAFYEDQAREAGE